MYDFFTEKHTDKDFDKISTEISRLDSLYAARKDVFDVLTAYVLMVLIKTTTFLLLISIVLDGRKNGQKRLHWKKRRRALSIFKIEEGRTTCIWTPRYDDFCVILQLTSRSRSIEVVRVLPVIRTQRSSA